MGRLPSGIGGVIKKGSWTPEEDLMLSSYIQENGPGNWASVPPSTGLNRCGKSCRLRWTNYLRPGIKRGNFTAEEDRTMIRLHDVLGNKWSAIAHYLPGRTDNDVKNYFNSHLKKNATSVPNQDSDSSQRRWERRLQENVHLARKALSDALSPQASIPDHEALSLSPPGTAPNSDATLPPTAPGLGSPLPVATAPLLSTGFMSFKPPRDWNQNASQQQLMIPAENHQFRSQAAAKSSQASNHSPYVFNYENIARWLPRWNKETPVSRLENNSARHPPLPPGAVTVSAHPAVLGRQHEASMPPALFPMSASPTGQNEDDRLGQLKMFVPYVPAPPAILGRQHEDSLPPALVFTSDSPTGQNENHSLLQLKMSVPYGQANSAHHLPLPPAAVIVPARPVVLGRQHEDSMPPALVPMSASPTGKNEDDRLRQLKMSVPYGQVNSAHHLPLPPAAVTVPAPPAVPGRQHEDFLPPDREFTSASPTEQNEDDRLPQLIMTVPYDQPTWPFF